jgi:hypothetical protein
MRIILNVSTGYDIGASYAIIIIIIIIKFIISLSASTPAANESRVVTTLLAPILI